MSKLKSFEMQLKVIHIIYEHVIILTKTFLYLRGESVLARVFTCWLKRNRYWVKSIRTNWGNLQTSKLDNPTPLLPPRLDYSALSRSR